MSAWEIDTADARWVHNRTSTAVGELTGAREKVRSAVASCASAAHSGDIPAALHNFWNSHAGVQAQAAQSKAKNVVAALDALIVNYVHADLANAEIASQAADAIPRDVATVRDTFS